MQVRIQDIQKEGAGTVSAKTLILACGKSMKYKWTITKKVMILSTSRNFIKNFSKIRGAAAPSAPPLNSSLSWISQNVRNLISTSVQFLWCNQSDLSKCLIRCFLSGFGKNSNKDNPITVLSLSHVPELNIIQINENGVTFGASVSMATMETTLRDIVQSSQGIL
jgi:hypothetical protein